MSPQSGPARLAELYTRFRGGKSFFVALLAFISTWLGLHFLEGFDPDLGGYNAILSTEASLALGVATLMAERQERAQHEQDAFQKQQLEYMRHLLEAQNALLRGAVGEEEGASCGSGSVVSSSSPPSSESLS